MYSFLIFLIFVFPIAYRRYLKSSNHSLLLRVLNISISYILFALFFSQFRIILWSVYESGFKVLWSQITSTHIPILYFQINELLFFILCFFISVLSLGIGLAKNNSRQFLLRMLPFSWFILIGHFIKLYMINTNGTIKNLYIVGFVNAVIMGFLLLGLYKFLSSKKVKQLYYSSTNNSTTPE